MPLAVSCKVAAPLFLACQVVREVYFSRYLRALSLEPTPLS